MGFTGQHQQLFLTPLHTLNNFSVIYFKTHKLYSCIRCEEIVHIVYNYISQLYLERCYLFETTFFSLPACIWKSKSTLMCHFVEPTKLSRSAILNQWAVARGISMTSYSMFKYITKPLTAQVETNAFCHCQLAKVPLDGVTQNGFKLLWQSQHQRKGTNWKQL